MRCEDLCDQLATTLVRISGYFSQIIDAIVTLPRSAMERSCQTLRLGNQQLASDHFPIQISGQ